MKNRNVKQLAHKQLHKQFKTEIDAAVYEFQQLIRTEEGALFFLEMMEEWRSRHSDPEPDPLQDGEHHED